MPSINLKKELYDTLIRKNIKVADFANEAVKEKLEKLKRMEEE